MVGYTGEDTARGALVQARLTRAVFPQPHTPSGTHASLSSLRAPRRASTPQRLWQERHRSRVVLGVPVRATLAAAAALVVAACGGERPSEAELARGVELALAGQPVCAADPAWKFPARIRTDEPSSQRSVAALDALARHSLLTANATTVTVPQFTFGPGGRTRDVRVAARDYALTEAGRALHRTYPAAGYGIVGAFCFGTWEVDVTGRKLSEGGMATVAFTRRLVTVPAWAKDPAVLAQAPNLARAIATDTAPVAGTMNLVKTDSGWVKAGL